MAKGKIKKAAAFFAAFCLLISCSGLTSLAETVDAVKNQTDRQIRVADRDGAGIPKAYYELDEQDQLIESTASSDTVVEAADGLTLIEKRIQAAGKENEFYITLNVTTSRNLKSLETESDAAIVLIMDVSGSMAWDLDGQAISDLNPRPSRMELATEAARSFLDEVARDAGDSIRLVSLVTFGTDATAQKGWVEINPNRTGNMRNLEDIKGTIDAFSPDGATNVEGALMVARNLMRQLKADASYEQYRGIENLNVILLTDGGPTASADIAYENYATLSADGWYDDESGATIDWEDYDDVSLLVSEISSNLRDAEATKIGASLYTIGFAMENRNVGTFQTGNEWLASFATRHWPADEGGKLKLAFEDIAGSLGREAQGWVVTDPMGDFIIFDEAATPKTVEIDNSEAVASYAPDSRTLTWDLKKDKNYKSYTDEEGSYRQYSLTYGVKLDVRKRGFAEGKLYPTNKKTVLEYTVEDQENGNPSDGGLKKLSLDFKVPAVHGYLEGCPGTTITGQNDDTPLPVKPPTSGGNGGNGGGNGNGGNGGGGGTTSSPSVPSTEIPEPDVPLTDIETPEIPDVPNEPELPGIPMPEEPEMPIPDSDIPLSDLPRTGVRYGFDLIVALLGISVFALAGVLVTRGKQE